MKAASGFTLFEMLIALAIFAVAASALVMANGQGIKQMDALQTRVLARWIGTNQAQWLHACQAWPEVGQTHRTETFARRAWYLVQTIKKTQRKRLRHFRIQVYEGAQAPHAQQPAVYQLTGYVLQTAPHP